MMAEGVPAGPIQLAGSETLARAYALAFTAQGLAFTRHADDIVARGLARIAETIAWS
ncbi:hypothetical protein [Dankookia sp. P2]|uniref:hypothetical protein n=1 Tax=Dankookia sp. P2 TaxID=3423955 RepID=UPI003D67F2DC